MSLALRVDISAPDLSGWREAVDPVALHKVLGRAYSNLLVDHFRARNNEPNAKGWPKTNFWSDVAKRTGFDSADADGATVVVGDPRFALKLFGGVVRPRTGKYLAIPLMPEVAGQSPREFEGLFPIRSRTLGKAYLATRDQSGALRVYFLLVKETVHNSDPAALPDADATAASLAETAADFIRSRMEKN